MNKCNDIVVMPHASTKKNDISGEVNHNANQKRALEFSSNLLKFLMACEVVQEHVFFTSIAIKFSILQTCLL